MPNSNLLLGLACAVGVIFVWSGFLVFSRMGVNTALTPFDIAALRFIVAGAVTAPVLLAWWPRHMGWGPIILLILCGPGSIYTLMLYFGLQNAPAAYAGVFTNGSLPIFTMLTAAVITRDLPGPWRLLGTSIIFLGGVMVGLRGIAAGGADVTTALAMFIGGSAILSVYIWGLGRWAVSPKNALAIINVPNLVIFLPVWWLFLPKGLAEADLADILFQAGFQGLGPGFLAVILFTLSVRYLGSTATSGFSAVVPAGAALLAIPVLGEYPTGFEWVGIGLVTFGLGIFVARSR